MANDKVTVLDLWCSFRGCQGGTIHQAKHDFEHVLTKKERDTFCGILVDSMSRIVDNFEFVREFMDLRLKCSGISVITFT